MPALYSASVVTPAAAAGAAYAALRTAAGHRARIRQIDAYVNAATASSVGLVRSASVGTASTSVLGQAWETGDAAAVSNVDTAWSAAPTAGSVFLKRYVSPATIGSGVIWTFPAGLVVPISSSILLWNYGGSAGSALSVTITWEE